MKQLRKLIPIVLAIGLLACNNQNSNANGPAAPGDSTGKEKPVAASLQETAKGGCGNNLLFREGTKIEAASYNGAGKLTSRQTSVVKKVYTDGGQTASELDMTTTDEKGGNPRVVKGVYRCDGSKLTVDLSSFVQQDRPGMTIKTSGIDFPFDVSVGQTLPDAQYSVDMTMGDKKMTIISTIKERKVTANESVTTPAGTFNAYKISAVVDAETIMDGLTDQMKKAMKEAKEKMGKSEMVFWYVPTLSVVRMELYQGNKLVSKNEVTSISK